MRATRADKVPGAVPAGLQHPFGRPRTPVSLTIEPALSLGTGLSTDPSDARVARFTPAT